MSPRAAARLESLGFTQVYDYVAGKADWAAMGLPLEGALADIPRAGDVARKGAPTCRLTEQLGAVRERVQSTGGDVCLVVDDAGVVLGRLRKAAFEKDPDAARPMVGDVEKVMEEGPTTIRPHMELEGITGRMQAKNVGSILVTRSNGHITSVMYREDAKQALER